MESSTRLGQHATTVLTNRSGYITVVSELPYIERQKSDFDKSFSRHGQYIRGSRPIHRTTFCFKDENPCAEFMTSTQKAHSGKRTGPARSFRPPKCQSLHSSHFYIGQSSELDLSTQTMKHFNRKQVIPASKLHKDRSRWNDQMMEGKLMNESLRHDTKQKMNNETTYRNVHNDQGWKYSSGSTKTRQPPERYNIISGAYIGPAEERCYKFRSGDRVLQRLREECKEGLLG